MKERILYHVCVSKYIILAKRVYHAAKPYIIESIVACPKISPRRSLDFIAIPFGASFVILVFQEESRTGRFCKAKCRTFSEGIDICASISDSETFFLTVSGFLCILLVVATRDVNCDCAIRATYFSLIAGATFIFVINSNYIH